MADCEIIYAPERGELTGLVRMGDTPWDQPNTWWLDCLVTWPIDPPRRIGCTSSDPRTSRTDGIILPVQIEPGSGLDVLKEAGRILTQMCASKAIVCHVRRPMDKPTIMAIQEHNAKLAAGIRARQKIEAEEARRAVAKAAAVTSQKTDKEPAADKPRQKQLAFA